MMTSDIETIKKVRLFGLNTYEAKIWSALLSGGVSTAGGLSDIANVPRSRSYDVLESLEKKGFVIAKSAKPIKYLAVQPKDVLESVKTKIKRDRDDYINYISNDAFSSLINSFQELHEKSANKDENVVAILKGRKNIRKHLDFLAKNSKKVVLSSIGWSQDSHRDAANETKSKIRAKEASIRLCLVGDNDALLFPLQEKDIHPDYDFCVWIKNRQTAKFLSGLLSFM